MSKKNKGASPCDDDQRAIAGNESRPSNLKQSAKELDQHYTKSDVAEACFESLRAYLGSSFDQYLFIEPSAGDGAFSRLLPTGSCAYDLDPRAPGIGRANFLETILPANLKIAVVGNPPFGRNASTAVDFFNHAATGAKIIAMIFPKSFRKARLQNRLDSSFRLVFEMAIGKDAFRFNGKDFHVSAVFQ